MYWKKNYSIFATRGKKGDRYEATEQTSRSDPGTQKKISTHDSGCVIIGASLLLQLLVQFTSLCVLENEIDLFLVPEVVVHAQNVRMSANGLLETESREECT